MYLKSSKSEVVGNFVQKVQDFRFLTNGRFWGKPRISVKSEPMFAVTRRCYPRVGNQLLFCLKDLLPTVQTTPESQSKSKKSFVYSRNKFCEGGNNGLSSVFGSYRYIYTWGGRPGRSPISLINPNVFRTKQPRTFQSK